MPQPHDEDTQESSNLEYGTMLRLEELESLLEEVEEVNEDRAARGNLPTGLRERMDELGVSNVADIRREIDHLNALLDEQDPPS